MKINPETSLHKSIGCDLKTCMVCRLSLPEWIPAVASNRTVLNFKKGDLIFEEGSPVSGMYFVNSGLVKVHKHWGAEKELIIRFARDGDIFGHRGFGKDRIFPVSATALAPSSVCFVDLAFFESSLRVNSNLAFQFMEFLANEIQESERNMRDLVHMPVKNRIAVTLVKLQEKFGTDPDGFIRISLSRQDVASYAGTTYETVFRVISSLEEEGVVKTKGKYFGILEKDTLKNYTVIS